MKRKKSSYFTRGSLLLCLRIFSLFFSLTGMAQLTRSVRITPANAAAWRDSLKLTVFGTMDFPYDIMPDAVITGVTSIDYTIGFPFSSLYFPAGNLAGIDKLAIQPSPDLTDFPQPVSVYIFRPQASNGKLFIYHSGHCASTAMNEDIAANGGGSAPGLVIPSLLAEGYTVLAVPMINYKMPYPVGYNCGYNRHDDLFIDGHYQHPLSLFFRPVIASLNHLDRSNYSAIYMTGLSGGGWTTSLYQALDTSISYSFPVAGSWPMPVRRVFYPSLGDYEQIYPQLYNMLDYQDIYTLACLEPARKMLQINNRYDNCCFAGASPHIYYADSVAKTLRGSDGVFKFYLDETVTNHQISLRALEVIRTFLRDETGLLLSAPQDTISNGEDYLYDVGANFTTTTAPDNSSFSYSLLKAPAWLSLDPATGRLSGVSPPGNIIATTDSISFKVEDSTGRFVVHNFNLIHRRPAPYFFLSPANDSIVYFLPQFQNSVSAADQLIAPHIYFNSPQIAVQAVSVGNNSVIRLKLNRGISQLDSVAYNGFNSPYALMYTNGSKLENFGFRPIVADAVKNRIAVAGMIRFNLETAKFEYFNGTAWINMN